MQQKYLIILVSFLFSSLSLTAQEGMPRLSLGARAGFQQSIVDFGVNVGSDYIPGVNAGFQLQYMSRRMVGFELGILYSQVGWLQKARNVPTYERKISTLEIPLMTHIAIGKGPIRVLVDAGPYLRFHLADSKNNPFPDPDTTFQYQLSDLNANSTYGLVFGGGLSYRTPKIIIQARGFYHLGLTNYFESRVDQFLVSAERSVGGAISVLLPIGQKYIDE